MSMLDIVASLVRPLDDTYLRNLRVIPWASPVISFGDASKSKIATLGLNPSNREFVDIAGEELTGPERRFHTLESLNLKSWSEAKETHLQEIIDSCNGYFFGNPYDGWFQALEKLIMGANVSYYGMFSNACHLDLVPYATECKWVDLTSQQRNELLKSGGDALALVLQVSPIEMLVLNGQSVIENLQLVSGITFEKEAIPDWTLPRKDSSGVVGYAYTGKISQISGIDLGREISILGFSHNIQSSYGVTNQVKNSIQSWITDSTSGVFC